MPEFNRRVTVQTFEYATAQRNYELLDTFNLWAVREDLGTNIERVDDFTGRFGPVTRGNYTIRWVKGLSDIVLTERVLARPDAFARVARWVVQLTSDRGVTFVVESIRELAERRRLTELAVILGD